MQNASKLVGISNIDDINAVGALYRPGPMQFIPDYARGKKDPASVSYPHPLLEPVLRETYGIIVYQEQVMECAKVIAGYTLGGADMLRRAMGKKKVEEMARHRQKFVDGAKARFRVIARHGTHDAAEMLATLTPENLRALEKQFDKVNKKFSDEYKLTATQEERRRARLEA